MNTPTLITTDVRIIGMSCSHCEYAVSAADAAGYDSEWPA